MHVIEKNGNIVVIKKDEYCLHLIEIGDILIIENENAQKVCKGIRMTMKKNKTKFKISKHDGFIKIIRVE